MIEPQELIGGVMLDCCGVRYKFKYIAYACDG